MKRMPGPLATIDALDRRLFERLTRKERGFADKALGHLSNAANRSLLWLAMAGLLAVLGGKRGRWAAVRGVLAIVMSSTLVNLPLKYLARRSRPRIRGNRPLPVKMPGSFSFPSGHSASAFAFTTATALEDPRALAAVLPVASAVAYSRVHLRVHYPLDVLVGAAIGTGMGVASEATLNAARLWWERSQPVPQHLSPRSNRLILVTSKNSGGSDTLRRARKAMSERNLIVSHEITLEQLAGLRNLLQGPEPQPIVVAAGGDGTVGAVANAIARSDTVLGILPLGTSNDFARSLELPMRVEEAVRLLARGAIRQVPVGRLAADSQAPRQFVHAAAAGLNVAFARFATRADARQRLGRLTYAVAAALALHERPQFDCLLEFGGRTEHMRLVHLAVVNAPVFGGFLDLRLPGSNAEDPLLHVITVEHLPIRRLLRSALYPAIGLHRRIRGFRVITASRITIRPQHPMDVTLDGEIAGKIPGTFEVVPDALKVIAPMRRSD
jgi:YegS/Rv2252/BmrU family lipid kinase